MGAATAPRWTAGALVAVLALVGVVGVAADPAAADGPTITLTVSASPVREGRPVTLTAEVHDAPDGFLPATARFVAEGGDRFLADVPMDQDHRAQLVVEDPGAYDYNVFVFASPPYGLMFGPGLNLEVIEGFTARVAYTTVPAAPQAGDAVVFHVTVTAQPVTRPTEGAPPPPTGLVRLRSRGQTLGQQALGPNGQAAIPITMPNAPVAVAYDGDDLFIDSTATPLSPADPPPPTTSPPTSVPGGGPVASPVGTPTAGSSVEGSGPPPTTTVVDDPADPVDETPSDVGLVAVDDPAEEAAAASTDGAGDEPSLQRSAFILGIPSPVAIDWGGAHVVVNLLLALLLMLLTGVPAALIDKTIEDNHRRIVRAFAGEEAAIHRAEQRLQSLPDPVLLAALSSVAAVLFVALSPSSGFDATSLVLTVALAGVVAVVVSVHDLARLPFLNRRFGTDAAAFGVYPFTLILAVALVVVSRLAGFDPGFVFGLIGTLALTETVRRREIAVSLAAVGAGLLVVAVVAWLLWHPIVDRVTEPDPGLVVIFLDAFLAGLWLMCLQSVAFGYAPMRFFDGGHVRAWSPKAWFAIQGTAMFLLVQFYLHPSAARWGALDETSMRSALSVWGVFMVVAALFWGWFRLRSDPHPDDEIDAADAEVSGAGTV